ncbi:hypothetical protein FHB93_06075, partial [Klebsiella quasipneumoniae]
LMLRQRQMCLRDMIWLGWGDVSIYTSKPSGGMCIFPSSHLMPIDGDDFSNEDERQKEREHA